MMIAGETRTGGNKRYRKSLHGPGYRGIGHNRRAPLEDVLGADLVAATVIYLHGKYYGWRYAGFLSLLLYICMVAAGVTVHYVFTAFGIVPTARPSLGEMVRFKIDYTFWLNIVFTVIGSALLILHFKGGKPEKQPSTVGKQRMEEQT